MKTLNFNKSSWHYRLASKFGGLDTWDNESDFCSYVRSVMLGLLLTSAIATIVVAATACFADLGAWIVCMIRENTFIQPGEMATIAMAILFVAGVLFGIIGVLYLGEKSKEAKRAARYAILEAGGVYVEPEPGFIVNAYRTFKHKTCFKVQLS